MKTVIRACIFDLDGVIVDTAHYHYLAWKRLAKELGIDLTPEHNEQLKGVSRMESLEIILNIGQVKLADKEKEAFTDRKNEWFVEYINEIKPGEIFPGVKPLIHAMRDMGLKVALASSSKNARRVIELLGVEDAFDAVVDGTMVTHSKPHPEIFLKAATRLQVQPAECLVFEDAQAGIEAAKRAGMKCIGIGKAGRLKDADLVLENTGDFEVEQLHSL